MGAAFLGLYPFQWLALVTAALALLLAGEALVGHYRKGFGLRAQYVPLISGAVLVVSAVAAATAPRAAWANQALSVAGWLALATGGVGFAFHHYYGIARKPGGYGWLLHHLMYGAPQLAPLAFAHVGLLALVTARGLMGAATVTGVSMRAALFGFVAIALAGAILQAGILHYRGAFNNPLMYAPMTAPLLAVFASVWAAFMPGRAALLASSALLWLTFLTGFAGWGMHLRGFERQMGGLYVTLFNLLEGPAPFAPALFAGFALVGLVAVHLL